MFKSLSLKVIIFGFIFTFFSSFGQSFFLGLFNSSIRDALSISHGQFGSIYASATLLSSFVLVWVGKKIDDVDVIKFASYVIIFLAVSCFIFSKISSVIFLFFGIFLMRLAGQGLTTHTATTTVSRFFEKSRGKALSTCWLGLSLAEFILPVLIVFLLTFLGWRDIWITISIIVIIILPIVAYLFISFASSRVSSLTSLINTYATIGKIIITMIEIVIHISLQPKKVKRKTINTGNINSAKDKPNQQVLKAFPLLFSKNLDTVVVAVCVVNP